jgi:hypothetical protein
LGVVAGYVVWQRRKPTLKSGSVVVSTMKVRQVTRLSSKAQLVAVEVQGRTLLLGTTDVSITHLGWLEDVTLHSDLDGQFADGEGSPESTRGVASSPTTRGTPLDNVAARRALPTDEPRERRVEDASNGPSRFRELLADAIGIVPKRGAKKTKAAPVDELVAATRDRYIGSGPGNGRPPQRQGPISAANLIDVEGQAKGLVARLNRSDV